jgi:hypothetical protein
LVPLQEIIYEWYCFIQIHYVVQECGFPILNYDLLGQHIIIILTMNLQQQIKYYYKHYFKVDSCLFLIDFSFSFNLNCPLSLGFGL